MSGHIEKLTRNNAEEASKILRAMVEAPPTLIMVPPPLLDWYLRRVQLDLLIADENRPASMSAEDSVELVQCMARIRNVEDALNAAMPGEGDATAH